MNKKILPLLQRKAWEKIAGVNEVRKFYLAGGTAIALHLGHRESLDFDFFSEKEFKIPALTKALGAISFLDNLQTEAGTLHARFEKVRVSFLHYPYPRLAPGHKLDGVEVADLLDLVAMKLVAISQRGSKKDYIDIYAILRSGWNLDAMFQALDEKFKGQRYNKVHILKSLSFFEEADPEPMPKMLVKLGWNEVKSSLTQHCKALLG